MPTVQEAFDLYLVDLEERMSTEVHIRTVRARLRHLLAEWGDRPLAELSRREIARQLSDINAGMAVATRSGRAATYKAFFRFCVSQEWTEIDLGMRLKTGDYTPQTRRAAPEIHLRALAQAIPHFIAHRERQPRDIRDALLVSLSLDSGARLSTMLNLRRADVEAALQDPNPTRTGGLVYSVTSRGKTGATEVVFFADTADLFREWLDYCPAGSPYVFISLRTLNRLRTESSSKAFVRICEFAGIPVIRSHAIRKRNIDRIIDVAHNPKVGQRYGGHKQLSTTLRHYEETPRKDVYDAAAELAASRRDEFASGAARLFGLREEDKG